MLRRGPAPTTWGLWGRPRLRPGRRRSGTPRQQRHRLRRRRCHSALPTHSPPGVAAPRGSRCRSSLAPRQAAPRALAPLRAASSLRGASAACSARAAAAGGNLYRRAHWRRKRRLPRASRAAGRGDTPPAGGICRPVNRPARPRQAPRWWLRHPCGGLACRCPGQRETNKRVSRPVAGHPPISQPRGYVMFCCVVARVPGMPGVWYLSGVAGGLPVLTLSRSCALVLPAVRAAAGVRWCRSACAGAGFLPGVRFNVLPVPPV